MDKNPQFIRIGLTGGIAAGKSTVAACWRERGAAVLDSDELAHRTYVPGTETYRALVQEFGAGITNTDGTINRPAVAAIVFADEQKRQALNQIVHPAVRRLWKQGLEELARDGQTTVAVVSIPLLYETGAEQEFDVVVTVGCSARTQLARLAAKGLSESAGRARIRAQLPTSQKMDRADFVIWNEGSLRVLTEQAGIIFDTIKERHHATSKV